MMIIDSYQRLKDPYTQALPHAFFYALFIILLFFMLLHQLCYSQLTTYCCYTPSSASLIQLWSEGDRVLEWLFSWSVLVICSLGMTSPIFQCPPFPPQFRHLQIGLPSMHSSNMGLKG